MNNMNGTGMHDEFKQAAHDAAEQVEETVNEAHDPLKKFVGHQKRALEETGKALESLLPEGFREHGKEARREFLKGMTVLVDAAVTELEKASKEADRLFKRAQQKADTATPPAGDDSTRPSSTGPQKVKVQVD